MVHIHIKKDGYNIIFKVMWIILSLIELYLICRYIPNKKMKVISNIGANTLNIYLLHSLLVKWLKVYAKYLIYNEEIVNIIIMLITTCVTLLILGNKYVKNVMIYLTDFNKVKENKMVYKHPSN